MNYFFYVSYFLEGIIKSQISAGYVPFFHVALNNGLHFYTSYLLLILFHLSLVSYLPCSILENYFLSTLLSRKEGVVGVSCLETRRIWMTLLGIKFSWSLSKIFDEHSATVILIETCDLLQTLYAWIFFVNEFC